MKIKPINTPQVLAVLVRASQMWGCEEAGLWMLLRLDEGKPNFTVLRARLWKNEVFFFTSLPSTSLCQQLLA